MELKVSSAKLNRTMVIHAEGTDVAHGQINAADVMIATQLALGSRVAGLLQLAHGDMNSDGNIDIADLLLIQLIALP